MVFSAKDHLTDIKGKDYLEVKWRIVWFRDEYPKRRIDTEVMSLGQMNWVKATVYNDDGQPYSTGMASIQLGAKGVVWAGKELEKAETAAIGRALAHAGYGTQFTGEDDVADNNLADSPVDQGNGHTPQLNIAELRKATRFMFDDDESHKTTIDMLLTTETIKPTYGLTTAVTYVMLTRASQLYEFTKEDMMIGLSANKGGNYANSLEYFKDHTYEDGWKAIQDYHTLLANTPPATAGNGMSEGNPFKGMVEGKTKTGKKGSRTSMSDAPDDPKADAPTPEPK